MGISRGAIKLMGLALREHRCSGSVVTFGVQGVQSGYDEAVALLSKAGKSIAPVPPEEIRLDDLTRYRHTIHQDVLFRLLGFGSVESIDFFPDEKPTHVLDLNRPVPAPMLEKFDLVFDGGTSEHCFATSEALCNAMRLVKAGGRVIHHSPLNNWVDHGFYQFSPTIFFDFYEANGFDQIAMAIHFIDGSRESYVDYDPRKDGSLPYGLGGGAKVLAFFSARKAAPLGEIVFPIQGRYRRTFGSERNPAATAQSRSPLARLKRSLRKRAFKWRATAL